MRALPAPAKKPCGSCPYRRDVPSGIWHRHEYEKLLQYDGETWQQAPAIFMRHQNDGHLCSGWLACHDTHHLLALRINKVDPSAFGYTSEVPLFGSVREAHDHGVRDIPEPGARANRMMAGLLRKRGEL